MLQIFLSKNTRRLLPTILGNAFSSFGYEIYTLCVALLSIKYGTALDLSIIVLSSVFTRLVLVKLGGHIADRIQPKIALIVDEAIWLCVLSGAVIYFKNFGFTLGIIIAVSILSSVSGAVLSPSYASLLPRIAKKDSLVVQVNSLNRITIQAANIVAPLAFGLLVTFLSPDSIFLLMPIPYLFSLLLFLFTPKLKSLKGEDKDESAKNTSESTKEAKDSATRLVNKFIILSAILFGLGSFSASGAVSVGLPYMSTDKVSQPVSLGLMMTLFSVGQLLGALFASRLTQKSILPVMKTAASVAGASILVVGLQIMPIVSYVSFTVFSISACIYSILFSSRIQERVADEHLGKAMSTLYFGDYAGMSLSVVLAGVLLPINPLLPFVIAAITLLLILSLLIINKKQFDINRH
jgi:MFS family permease